MNPLLWRDLQLFRRVARARVNTYLGLILAPFLGFELIYFFLSHNAPILDIVPTMLTLSSVLWLGLLTMQTLLSTTASYQRERDLGALPLVTLTTLRPREEVLGRFAGCLLPVACGWASGALLVVLFTMCTVASPQWPAVVAAALAGWVVVGLWILAIGALGMFFASCTATSSGAFMGVICTVLGGYFFYPTLIVFLASFPGGGTVARLLIHNQYACIPPLPSVLLPYLSLDWSLQIFALQFMMFLALIAGALWGARYNVQRGVPLSRRARINEGARGLMPSAAATPTPAYMRPDTNNVPSHPLSFIADAILWPFRQNPYYVAYRRGYIRLYAGQGTSAPGSAVPTGLLICAIAAYGLAALGGANSDTLGGFGVALLVMVGFASLISALQAFALASRSMSSERDQATWPLLVVSGMRPERVLGGKFAAALYSVSGEWLFPLPLWIMAAVLSGRPLLLLLALIHPAFTAAGVLAGLGLASMRVAAANKTRLYILLGVLSLLIFAVYLSPVEFGFALFSTLSSVDPFYAAWCITAKDFMTAMGATMQLSVWAAVACLLCVLAWRGAASGLRRVMTGV